LLREAKSSEQYIEQATDLYTGRSVKPESADTNITIFTLCNLYLEYQELRVEVGEITARHYEDQVNSLRTFVRFLGRHRQLNEISTLDLQNYKRKRQKA